MKKKLLLCLSLALIAAMLITGTMAYFTDTDSDANVMTLGNVDIAQHEYERVVDADGNYEKITVTKADGSTQESYKLQEFTQAKPLYPAVGNPNGGYDPTYVRFEQLGDPNKVSGGQQFFADLKNAQDKIVLVENTGKSDAYVRTIFAFEMGELTSIDEWHTIIMDCTGNNGEPWSYKYTGVINIDGNNFAVMEAVYTGYSYGNMRHNGGILPAGEWTYNSLAEVYMTSDATNEDAEAIDGNKNGTYDILVLSQAVQTAGFADAQTALDTGFGKTAEKAAEWFGGITIPEVVQGDVVGSSTDYGYHVADGESVVFDDIDVTSGGGISVWGTAEFNSGSIVTNSTSTSGRHVFYLAAGNDGEGLLTINDGEFTFSPNNLQRKGYYICAHGEGAIVIVNGGTFNKPSQRTDGMISSDPYKGGICEYEGGQVIIRGGSFAFDPTEWVDEGYEAVKDDTTGYWTVSTKN